MANYDSTNFEKEYEAAKQRVAAKNSFEEEYEAARLRVQGRKVTAPVTAVKQNLSQIQQQNYDRMQNLFAQNNAQEELNEVEKQLANILAVQGRDDVQRQQLNDLVARQKELNTQLGNPTQLERAKLSGEALVKNIVASPVAAADMLKQVATDPVEMEIQVLERKADQGVLDAAGWQRLKELKPQQYTKTLDTRGWSWQMLQEAKQAQEKASKGFDGAEQFLYDTGMSMATNIATLPVNLVAPGASLALMGTQSMANKALDVAEKGGSAGEAFGRGLASGGIEMLTEAASLDTLAKAFKGNVGKTIVGRAITKIVNDGKISPTLMAAVEQSFSEGGEELVSAIANYAADKAAGDPEAKLTAEELVLSFLGGAISGGLMGAGASVVGRNNVSDTNDGNIAADNNVGAKDNNVPGKKAENDTKSSKSAIKSSKIDTVSANNVIENANNVVEVNNLQQSGNTEQLKKEMQQAAGIDTRTEVEKVAEEQQQYVDSVRELVENNIAPAEHLEQAQQKAAETVAEAKAKESIDYAVKLIEYAGKEADIYSDSRDRAAAYNTAKRIGINLAHSNTTAMGRAVHEVGHDKTATKQWADYTAALDKVISTDGRLVKLMEDIDYEYRNSADADIRSSVSFADGTIDNAKVRNEQYLKLTEIMLPNIAKGDKQLLDAIKKDRNVIDNLLDFIRGIKNKVSIKLTKSEAAMLDEAERQLVNLLRSESKTSAEGVKKFSYGNDVNVENTEIDDNPSTHTPEELKIIEEFKNSVDYELVDYIQKARTDEYVGKYKVTETTARAEQAMKDLTKLPKVGKYMVINKNTIQHIDYGHGKLGESDSTMSNDEDIARIKYVLDNFDNAYLSKKDTKATKLKNGYNAPMVLFEKKVDGHYVVVEAVTDASTNNNLIISAFFSKNGINQTQIKEEWQVSKAESDKTQSADFTAKPLPSYSSNTKVPQTAQNSNGNNLSGNSSADYSLQGDIDSNEYWGENSKSRAVERHAVNEFTNYVAELFGVEYKDKTEILKKQAWKLADAAKKTGVFSTQQMLDFFNDAYNLGKQEIGNISERNAALKKELHNLGIKPLKGREYIDFVQKYKGKIMFNRKGLDIDEVYPQLCEDYPEWFSEDVQNPYDMIRRIGEVYDSIQGKKVSNSEYFGSEAEAFKSAAMQQYTALVDNFIDTMNSVSRYQLALADQKRQQSEDTQKVYTIKDVENARKLAQPLLKEIARLDRKNLFTAEDRSRLNEMLKLSHPADVNRMQDYLRETNPLAEEIIEMYEKKKMLEAIQKPIFEYNKQRKAKLKSKFLDILQTSDSWKDKGKGLAYMNNTFERNVDDIVTDKKAAEALKDALPRQIHKHVADATRYKNKLRNKIRGFNIDTNKTYDIEVEVAGEILKGKATEADLIQMYGEGIVTETYLDKIGANTNKIVETADKFREIYNELFEKINAAYVANGYAPMEYRQDYFPHFFDDTGDTLLNKAAAFLGFDAKNMLPTEIAGRTHEFSPGRQWNSHALQRKGEKTDYNVLKGFDNYIEAAANIIHLTEDIQNLRAFENAIRYKYSDEGMKAELDAIDALTISETEKEKLRKDILGAEDRNTKLNNFVVWEHEYTNLLAGKKSKADRWIEDMFGRRFYTVAKNIENRVSANMIAGNISSALTNFIPLTQLTAEVDGRYILTAMSDTIKNMKNNDSFVDMSDFLTNRFGSEMLSLTKMQKAANTAGKPMELVDEFTSNVVTRARYLQNKDKGNMDSVSAMREADEYAAGLMADRSKGALPTIFESKNPIIKLFTMFQVEQNNQLQYLFKDLPRKKQEYAKGWLLWAFIKMGIFSFLYNWMFEQIAGRKPAFSPVDMIYDTGKDIAQVAKGEKKPSAAMGDSFVRTVENLPYASSVLAVAGLSEDAGRIPVSGALPDFSQVFRLWNNDVSAEKKKSIAKKELMKPVYYLAAPFAGGAVKKIDDTVGLYGKNDGVQYSVQNDGSKKVQFANDPGAGAVVQSAIFGKWASKPAQEYINSGFKGLSKKQTEAFDGLKETGMSNKDAWAAADWKAADTDDNNSIKTEEAKAYLNSKNFTREQKAILFSCMCPNVKNNPYE